jgi:hypothetical protein
MTTIRRRAGVAVLLAGLVVMLLPNPAWAPRTFALISIAGPCTTPDGLRGSFTGSAFIQRFEAREDALTAEADLSGVCTDGTTFVPMKPATMPLDVHVQSSSCDAVDLTFGSVDTGAFVADLTNSHTVFDSVNKKTRRALCGVATALGNDKPTEQLARALNKVIGVKNASRT